LPGLSRTFSERCFAARTRPFVRGRFPHRDFPARPERDGEPRLVDRFEAFAGGFEIANAFHRLNDPRDQESRSAPRSGGKRGNEEAMPYDATSCARSEPRHAAHGRGGIGIDRLVMLFTDSPSIRDVIPFSALRPEAEGA